MTRRLAVLASVGVAAIAAASIGALLTLRGPTAPPPASPTWGLFDDAEWASLAAELPSFDAASMHVVAAFSKGFALIGDDGRCVALVRGARVSTPICTVTRPVLAFAEHDGPFVNVVGLTSGRVSTLVVVHGAQREGAALLRDGRLTAFGFSTRGAPTLEALDGSGAVVARLYCASALRGVCGISAHRRS